MTIKQIRDIDFTNGIKSENIQYNFQAVEEEIARERLAIAGSGVSSGLEFSNNGFTLSVSAGSLVDVDGKEVFFDQLSVNIQLPRLITTKTVTYTVGTNGVITLPNIPYATTRKTPSEFATASNYGITVVDYSNSTKTLSVVAISGKNITVDARWEGKLVNVTYSYTDKRYDTVYINENYAIRVLEGITSSSPSVVIPEKYKYILGYVEVDPFHMDSTGSKSAIITIKKDLKHLRNVYTDASNRLYICGVPFDDLQIIQMAEPAEPDENQLWYDAVSNKLRVWKTIDGIAQWVNVNDTSIIPVLEYKIWTPDQMPTGRQLFLFHYANDMNMRFTPNRNCLEILIDQVPLHSDQFEEVTIEDAMQDASLKQLLMTSYGYDADTLASIDSNYENVGIGFKLGSALDKDCFVEARATHRVNDNPLARRFQRTATFVASDSMDYHSDNGMTVATNAPYRVGECQLEVYVDGRRLDPKTDYTEGADLEVSARVSGAASRQFTLLKQIAEGSRLAYKITSTIYSYDHVEEVVGDLATRIESAEQTVGIAVAKVEDFVTETTKNVADLQQAVENVEMQLSEHSTFLKKTDVLTMDNLPATVQNWIPKGLINQVLVKSGTLNPVAGISTEDFIMMFDMQSTGGNSILRRGTDYELVNDSTGAVYVNFIDPNIVANGHTLYITGIKFSA